MFDCVVDTAIIAKNTRFRTDSQRDSRLRRERASFYMNPFECLLNRLVTGNLDKKRKTFLPCRLRFCDNAEISIPA